MSCLLHLQHQKLNKLTSSEVVEELHSKTSSKLGRGKSKSSIYNWRMALKTKSDNKQAKYYVSSK